MHSTLPFPGQHSAAASSMYDECLRVDHAGELAAVNIYAGQLFVLRLNKKNQHAAHTVQHMARQEAVHLRDINKLVAQYGVRRSALQPLWRAAGFCLGAVTAAGGAATAMACTVAVEEVIEQHYLQQIATLEPQNADPAVLDTLKKCCAEEVEHRETATSMGADTVPRWVGAIIKTGCKAAIAIAKKI